METAIKYGNYDVLLKHVDDLKVICNKLKLNVGLLEIPIHNAARDKVIPINQIDAEEESSSASSSSSSEDAFV